MEIGDVLKKIRKDKQLTQKEFAAHIFSHSFYSKIESGEHQIRAVDLFQLLEHHSISLKAFYDLYTVKNESMIDSKQIEKNIMLASYSKDLAQFPKILKQIEMSSLSSYSKKLTSAQARLIWAITANNNELISEADKLFIKNYIFSKEEWSDDWLALLSNSLSIFDLTDISILIQTILTKELREINFVPLDRLLILYSLCINFSYKAIELNLEHFAYLPLKYLSDSPDHYYFIIHKSHAKFIEWLLDYRNNQSELAKNKALALINQYKTLDMTQTADAFYELWKKLA